MYPDDEKSRLKDDEVVAEAPTARAKGLREEILGSALSLDEVAYILGLDRTTVAKYLRENVITGFQIGREWLVPEDELRAYVRRLIEQPRGQAWGDVEASTLAVNAVPGGLFGRMRRDLVGARKHRGASDRFERFTDRARRVLTLSQSESQRFNHNYIGTEHLLLGLIREGEGVAAQVLANLHIELEKARSAVESVVGRGDKLLAGDVCLTPRTKAVLELAVEEAKELRHDYVGTEHLLLGLLREGEGVGAHVLITLGTSLDAVRAEVKRVLATVTSGNERKD